MTYKFKNGIKKKVVFVSQWNVNCVDCAVQILKGEYVIYDGQSHCGCKESA